jgi:hypothetical protein
MAIYKIFQFFKMMMLQYLKHDSDGVDDYEQPLQPVSASG